MHNLSPLHLPGGRSLKFDRPLIAGILNITPDSFSDGGRYADPDIAVMAGLQMARAGADLIDVGGESTRPGSARTPADLQIARVQQVIRRLSDALDIPISIDTTLAPVAQAALAAGACIINDVSAGQEDPRMIPLAASSSAGLILMHMRGEPGTMQLNPEYRDVVSEVKDFLEARAMAAELAGVARRQIILDPGIGFGKNTEHNLQLIAGLRRFASLGYPVMLGVSRKNFIGQLTGLESPAERDAASAGLAGIGVMNGASLFRVHDVASNRQVVDVTWAVLGASNNQVSSTGT